MVQETQSGSCKMMGRLLLSKYELGISFFPLVSPTYFDFINWFFRVKSQSALFTLTRLDKILSLISGKDYIEGGIEYFDKQLKMNKALRNLLHDGQSTYAVSGNYNFFIRQKSLPLTVQKSLLEEDLRKLDPSAVEESLDLL